MRGSPLAPVEQGKKAAPGGVQSQQAPAGRVRECGCRALPQGAPLAAAQTSRREGFDAEVVVVRCSGLGVGLRSCTMLGVLLHVHKYAALIHCAVLGATATVLETKLQTVLSPGARLPGAAKSLL